MFLNNFNAPVEELNNEIFSEKEISVNVLRLDKIHPVISGNKIFKLHFFINEAVQSLHQSVITFGGPYSNHLVATAYACKLFHLKCTGIVRGEKPEVLSDTLQQCKRYGMQLKFISRASYMQKEEKSFLKNLISEFGESIIIPEGGYHPVGAMGAALIPEQIKTETYTHFCTAVGTGTTLAGLLNGTKTQHIIGVPVLKGMNDVETRLNFLCNHVNHQHRFEIFNNYHFGGYAKKTPELINFMNNLWLQHQIPTDFVYTGKLFFAIFDKISSNYFRKKSKILCLHTGGLQGNSSLKPGTLLY